MKKMLGTLRGAVVQGALAASAIIALISLLGFMVAPQTEKPLADMHIEPTLGAVTVGHTFVVDVIVTADTPVNVFRGEVQFDPEKLSVDAIDYNTSIADLWAERPWYENGEGTLNFIGGTTRSGGFLGTGSLITISFRALTEGDARIRVEGARILEHNGLGTDVALGEPIDTIFTVDQSILESQTVARPTPEESSIAIVHTMPSTDLSGDGKQTIADVSIFMMGMITDDPKFDFNVDGSVNTKDLSILMGAK